MKYFMAVIGNEANWKRLSPEETQAALDRMNVFNDELKEAGVWVSGAGLDDLAAARTIRFGQSGDPVVTDGPFAEAKEQIAGYWVVECASIDEAVDWVRRAPLESSAVEVRGMDEG